MKCEHGMVVGARGVTPPQCGCYYSTMEGGMPCVRNADGDITVVDASKQVTPVVGPVVGPTVQVVLASPEQPKQQGGLRYNTNKPPYHLVSPHALEGLTRVLQFGAVKYSTYGACTCQSKTGTVTWQQVWATISGLPKGQLVHAADCKGLKPITTGERNWEKGLSWSGTLRSLLAHTFAVMRGERLDKESGLPHIDHLGCNWMFLSHFFHTKTGTDDLPKDKQ